MTPMEGHEMDCKVWDWHGGRKTLNNALPCTCGYRQQTLRDQMERLKRQRALRPLGMSEADWLRTMGIKPEED